MIYLDYSATTNVNKEVLASFSKSAEEYFANPNSMHKLGVESKKLIEASTKKISELLKVKESEIIYTSGATESNNTAIKSIAYTFKNRGNRIITTDFEHSSIYEPLEFLKKQGFIIDIVKTDENGIVSLDDLRNLITDETILVTIASVNSEIGIRQPVEEIAKIVKEHPKCFFHVDATQSIGKDSIDFTDIDLASMSAHKFYGLKGIGILIKKENIRIEPLIHGGKSTTIYRAGTPALPLIVSTAKALRLALENYNDNYSKVLELNKYLKEQLLSINGVVINSNSKCIPHIINISLNSIKPETMQHALEEYDIYISTRTACSTNDYSRSVMALTNDRVKASTSIRVSISHLTTKEEIDVFVAKFKECFNKLNSLS